MSCVSSSWMMRAALICHSGGCSGLSLQRLQGENSVHHLGKVASLAPGAGGGEARFIRHQKAEVERHALLQPLRELEVIGEDHLAVRLEHADVAGRGHHVGMLVVCDRVREEDAIALRNLDMAARDDEPELVVVGHAIGGEQRRCGRRRSLLDRPRRPFQGGDERKGEGGKEEPAHGPPIRPRDGTAWRGRTACWPPQGSRPRERWELTRSAQVRTQRRR